LNWLTQQPSASKPKGEGVQKAEKAEKGTVGKAEDLASGVSRIRPAVFRALDAAPKRTRSAPTSTKGASAETEPGGAEGPVSRGSNALRAYRPAAPADESTAAIQAIQATQRKGEGSDGLPIAVAAVARAGQGPVQQGQPPSNELEQQITPLRAISRELVARGMPAPLVADLLSEIVAEYGNQVLTSERDARLALVEALLQRIPEVPLVPLDGPLRDTYLVTGPAGSGKSVLLTHLALIAARRGQRDVVLINTKSMRLGAAAQMTAVGAVFGYDVEHIYSPQDLRALRSRRGSEALLLVETAGWSPRDGAPESMDRGQKPWRWKMPGASIVVCSPATGQHGDLHDLLAATRQMAAGAVAVLSKVGETRNVLPALGALALLRQPLGMVVPGPDLTADTAPPALAEVARAALGVVTPQKKRGRVRC